MHFDDSLFDPENLEHWLLLLSYLALNIYALWLIFKNPVKKGKASHRYNRNTRLIEGNED